MGDKPGFLTHPASMLHDTGVHPEHAQRIRAIEAAIAAAEPALALAPGTPAPAQRAHLTAVHTPAHVDRIEALVARGGGHIDADTSVSAGSWDAALAAAGAGVHAVDRLLAGDLPNAFCAVRPPGHHATAGRAMGFCLFNNAAVAAARALTEHGLERVLILDWDVHHGNGTNDIFAASPQVLYASIHQSPHYPGTGGAGDVGMGVGEGYTLNMPVPPGSGDEVFASLVGDVVAPLALHWRPQLLIVSAGFDAHGEDPLADCAVTEAGYGAMTESVAFVGRELNAPVLVLLEGGYDPGALGRSVVATLRALAERDPQRRSPGGPHPLAVQARMRLERYFPDWPA